MNKDPQFIYETKCNGLKKLATPLPVGLRIVYICSVLKEHFFIALTY